MIYKNKFLFVLMCLLFFISMSCVCAGDNVNVTAVDNSVDVPVCNAASFDDLENDVRNLNPGDIYNVTQDYVFECSGFDFGHEGIVIDADNVTINGNGHVIDGNFKSALFKVTGDNVTIFNLTFVNSLYHGHNFVVKSAKDVGPSEFFVKYVDDVSPVCWLGDNGLLSDCVFSSNAATNGGAVTWMGNNGVINNTLFINNVARGVGGAIYIGGINNTIENTTFTNSTSLLSGEAIYIDRKNYNITISGVLFNQNVYLIDGSYNDIDVEYLKYEYYSYVGDKRVNLFSSLYRSVVCPGASYLDNETYCIARNHVFDENSPKIKSLFTLSILREFDVDDIVYEKNYLFYNAATINDIYSYLMDIDFSNSFDIIKNVHVNGLKDYENLCKADVNGLVYDTKSVKNIIFPDIAKDSIGHCNVCLNISFAQDIVLNSNTALNVGKYFNEINIVGNGARIMASTEIDDEYTWIENSCQYYTISNLTIDGFNHGIFNYGNCILSNVKFENNHIVFTFDKKDWGAAILNVGTCICYNCTFSNNVANCGGAIYNQGLLTVENCSFYSNYVEGSFLNSIGITTGGIGVDICNLEGVGNVYAAQKIDYDEVKDLDALQTTSMVVTTAALSFVVGVGVGYLTGSIKAGAVAGAAVGACIGAVGSLLVCYNTMDVTFNDLQFSLLLIGGSMVAGAIGGAFGGYIAEVGNYVPEIPAVEERPEYDRIDLYRLDSDEMKVYYTFDTEHVKSQKFTQAETQAVIDSLTKKSEFANFDLSKVKYLKITVRVPGALGGSIVYTDGSSTLLFIGNIPK